LALTQCFFDQRLKIHRDDLMLFRRLEQLGDRILDEYTKPCTIGLNPNEDDEPCIHIYPVVMHWAGLDRLAKIAHQLGLNERERIWQSAADEVTQFIMNTFWSDKEQCFYSEELAVKGPVISPHLLMLPEVGFLSFDDPRFVQTLRVVEENLTTKEHPFVLSKPQDTGHCFILYTLWYTNALHGVGRTEESRKLFGEVISCCNGCGTVSETIDPHTRELWGNFPHALSTTSIIFTALRLSIPWRNMI